MSRTALLRERALVALLAAEVISTTGAQMTWLALPWFVIVTTHSATQTTYVVAAEVIGLGAARLPGRSGPRPPRRASNHDALRRRAGPPDDGDPRAALERGAVVPDLDRRRVLLGALAAPSFAAQKVIVPELLGEGEQQVTEANALFQAANRTTLLAGPALAGVLIGLIGATSVLLVDAATYVVSVALVAGFVPQRPPVAQESRRTGA